MRKENHDIAGWTGDRDVVMTKKDTNEVGSHNGTNVRTSLGTLELLLTL